MAFPDRLLRAVPLVVQLSLAGCGATMVAEGSAAPIVPACESPAEPATDPRRLGLLSNATVSFAQGDHASAIASLRAAASLGASPLDDAVTRATLARLPLPVVATPSSWVHERSADGTTLAFIAEPPSLRADADVASLCERSPLEWANLAQGTRGSIPIPALAAGDRLAPLLALDAQALEHGHRVRALRDPNRCEARVDTCGSEPQEPEQLDIEAGNAAALLLPRHQLCGLVEGLSPHGRFAVVALPEVRVGRMGDGFCTLPARPAWTTGIAGAVCVGTRYQVIALADGRVALDAAAGTDALRIARDERHAYVRTRDGARIVPLEAGLAEVALAADCRGPVAFAGDGESLVAVCGARIDVVTLGESTTTRSFPLDTHGLGSLRTNTILSVAADAAVERIALVFAPTSYRPRAHHRWALLDGGGRVTYRVDEEPTAPQVEATPVAPVYERSRVVPVVRGTYSGPGCAGYDHVFHGQTLALPADVGARFEGHTIALFGRHPGYVPAEFWSLADGPRRGGGLTRMRLVLLQRAFEPGEWLTTEAATPSSSRRLVFTHASLDEHGERGRSVLADHPVGPSRWDAPDTEGDATPIELAAFLASTGSRTNLRVCPDDLRVVAVWPTPAADTVWADQATCAQPAPPPSSEGWVCRGGWI